MNCSVVLQTWAEYCLVFFTLIALLPKSLRNLKSFYFSYLGLCLKKKFVLSFNYQGVSENAHTALGGLLYLLPIAFKNLYFSLFRRMNYAVCHAFYSASFEGFFFFFQIVFPNMCVLHDKTVWKLGRKLHKKTKGSMIRIEHRLGVCGFVGVEFAFLGEEVSFEVMASFVGRNWGEKAVENFSFLPRIPARDKGQWCLSSLDMFP